MLKFFIKMIFSFLLASSWIGAVSASETANVKISSIRFDGNKLGSAEFISDPSQSSEDSVIASIETSEVEGIDQDFIIRIDSSDGTFDNSLNLFLNADQIDNFDNGYELKFPSRNNDRTKDVEITFSVQKNLERKL